jgi:energy-coupling factor transporter transmembrane protein EcfT
MLSKYITINDLVFLVISFIYVGAILISNNTISYLMLTGFALINLVLFKKINSRLIILFCLTIIPGLLVIFIVASLFANPGYSYNHSNNPLIHDAYWQLWGINVSTTNVYIALNLVTRTATLAVCSFVFIAHINVERVILCAMKQLHLPVKIGYAILAMNNALGFLRDEFLRIRSVYKIRFRKKLGLHKLLYPLLISASRYAAICGMSLVTRNLNNKKTFVVKCRAWQLTDSLVLAANCCLVILMSAYSN